MSQHAMLVLSRWQWAITAVMHITFPAITVGTSLFMVLCYGMYMRSNDETWLQMFRFWRRIFGIGFAIGVVSGIFLTFEFGLNWGRFAHDVGPIIGVIIAMEVVSAFFLEAGFLGLVVYGDGRIGKRTMMFSLCMVSLGTLLSVTWILVANSWMQTPAGYKTVKGQFQPVDWLRVIFNPSFGIRMVHMLVAVLISASWFIGGISAWYLVKHRHHAFARRGLSVTLGVLTIVVPIQMFIGDSVAGYVAQYKPPELEALEGNWNSTNTSYNLIVIPDEDGSKNLWQFSIPWMGSAISKDFSGNTPTPGLDKTPPALRPNMIATFYGFRTMYYCALLMLAVALTGLILRLRGRLYTTQWFHKFLVWMVPVGFLAIWGGWITAETGRQPWIVYGKLPTAAAVSPLKTWPVVTSFSLLVIIYCTLLGTYSWYVARVVRQGPAEEGSIEARAPVGGDRPAQLAPAN
jgi:cytochrome bd ubiquinol oxidase subunit I